jgi:hypothetical protein
MVLIFHIVIIVEIGFSGEFLFDGMVERGEKMFGDDGVGIMGKDLVLKVFIRGGVLAELDVEVGKTGICEVTLMELFVNLLIEVEQLEFEELLELV